MTFDAGSIISVCLYLYPSEGHGYYGNAEVITIAVGTSDLIGQTAIEECTSVFCDWSKTLE